MNIKALAIFFVAACAVLTSQAQHRVIVDPEVKGYYSAYKQNLYDATVNAFKKVGFVELITDGSQGVEEADFRITMRLNEIISRAKRSDTDFKYQYKIPFQLSLIRLSDNTVIGSQSFNIDGDSDDSKDDAIKSAFDRSNRKIIKFINDKIPYRGRVLELTEASGNKARQLYISLGSRVGIQKGQTLEIKAEASVSGHTYLKSLGKIKVEEVEGEEGSRCKVTDGHEQILKAYSESPDNIVVMTTKDWGIGDWWNSN